MAWDDPISISFDVEQPRVTKDRNLVVAQGSFDGVGDRAIGWDLSAGSNTAVDRATYTAFLGPHQQSLDWYKTFTGNYARLPKSDFSFSESAKWKEAESESGAGDIWLLGSDLGENSTGITVNSFAKNRGFYIAYHDFNSTGEDNLILWCGWNSSASEASGVSFKIYSSGKIAIYKDGVYRGQGTLSDNKSTQQEFVSVIVLPGRHRELMFIPNVGKGFTVEFSELAGESDPTITGATKFWFKCPRLAGQTMKIQIAPLTFPESGYICSQKAFFAEPPLDTDTEYTPALVWSHEGYGGTTSVEVSMREATNPATTFAPNGVKDSCYVRFDLTGDGEYTPFVYGGLVGFELTRGVTDDSEEANLLDITTDRTFSVGETPDSSSAEVHVLGLPGLVSGLADPIGHGNRPVRVHCGDYTLFEGVSMPARVEGASHEGAFAIAYEIGSLWTLLEDYQFRSTVPLDGVTLQSAIEFVIQMSTGLADADINVEDPGITISRLGAQATGVWAMQIEQGDRASDVIERLFTTYLGNWFYDFMPKVGSQGVQFVALSPASMGTTVDAVLWGTVEDAISQLISESVDAATAGVFYEHRIWRDFEETGVRAEANELRVTGMNPRTGQPIQSFVRDSAAQDPTTAPSSRPANWCGYPMLYTLMDPALTSQDDCDDAAAKLSERLFPRRRMVSFESTLIRLSASGRFLQKGDRVTLKNVYDAEDVTVRISGFECDLESEAAPPFMKRVCHYFGEVVSGEVAWRGSLRASNLAKAVAIAKERARGKQTFPLGFIAASRRRGISGS